MPAQEERVGDPSVLRTPQARSRDHSLICSLRRLDRRYTIRDRLVYLNVALACQQGQLCCTACHSYRSLFNTGYYEWCRSFELFQQQFLHET